MPEALFSQDFLVNQSLDGWVTALGTPAFDAGGLSTVSTPMILQRFYGAQDASPTGTLAIELDGNIDSPLSWTAANIDGTEYGRIGNIWNGESYGFRHSVDGGDRECPMGALTGVNIQFVSWNAADETATAVRYLEGGETGGSNATHPTPFAPWSPWLSELYVEGGPVGTTHVRFVGYWSTALTTEEIAALAQARFGF